MQHAPSNTTASVVIMTASDTRTLEDDKSGEFIAQVLLGNGHSLIGREVVKEDRGRIESMVSGWLQNPDVQVIIVTGGTGASPRDITPDILIPMFDSVLPGFGELFRQLSYKEIGAASMLSRAEAGWIDVGGVRKIVFLIPGSPNAVRLAMEELILPQLGHLLDITRLEQP
jgi:molybdenum cofactor biosynthesis protein B